MKTDTGAELIVVDGIQYLKRDYEKHMETKRKQEEEREKKKCITKI